MKKEMLKDYLENGKLNIDKMLDDFYGYVYIIVKNGVSSHITDELHLLQKKEILQVMNLVK